MYKTLSLILCCLLAQIAIAQNTSDLKDHLTKIAKGESSVISKKDMGAYTKKNTAIILLDSYLKSDNEKVQREAVRLCSAIGAAHEEPYTRQIAVKQLLNVAPTAPTFVVRQIINGLKDFKQEDFDKEALMRVSTIVKKEQPHQSKWVELAGFLQLKEALVEIRYSFPKNKKMQQKIGLALTRCGDEEKKESLMRNIQNAKINDEFVYSVVPLLAYARQKETMDFLFNIILSEEKNCEPAGPDIEGNIECGYRVMEEIAPYIKDIPLEIGASGDLKTKDYKKTLKDTRAWIVKHRSDYEMITNIF